MIVHIGDYTSTGQWTMNINLAEVCRSCGVRETVRCCVDGVWCSESGIALRQDHARKLFKQIWKYADQDTLKQADEYVRRHENKKARKQWDAAGKGYEYKRRLFAAG